MPEPRTRVQNIVVTPIWKPALSADELSNVTATRMQLSEGQHLFLAPRSLDVRYYQNHFAGSAFIRVEDRWLESIDSYSLLLLHPQFYGRFRAYEFLVICQTDAFLTRPLDRVLSQAAWDYCGAPWEPAYTVGLLDLYVRGRKASLVRPVLPSFHLVNGNGGLSARRVSATRKALTLARPLVLRTRMNEDIVLSVLARIGLFKAASLDQARALFFEGVGEMPGPESVYGYHALQKHQPDMYHSVLDSVLDQGGLR